jgi:hypothetical protein
MCEKFYERIKLKDKKVSLTIFLIVLALGFALLALCF